MGVGRYRLLRSDPPIMIVATLQEDHGNISIIGGKACFF
jgi:hypothetical protein